MSTMAATGSVSAGLFDDFIPFYGVDYYQSWRKLKNDLGVIFPRSYPGITVYIGGKFTEFSGIEVGYDISARESKSWVLPAGTTIDGVTTTGSISGTTSVRFMGGHIDFIGYLPIQCVINSCELFGTVGYGNISGLRLGVGANYMLNRCMGLRGKLGYENNSGMSVNNDTFVTNFGFSSRPYKYATTLSLGAFFIY